jgi:hypothetical protein
MTELPPRGKRATARRFEEFHYRTSEDDGWVISEWRLRAIGVITRTDLEGWYGPADAEEPVVGKIRIKRRASVVGAEIEDLASVVGGTAGERGVTEVLNLELEPLFFGQRLGVRLLRFALSEIPGDEVVVLEPTPTMFVNVEAEDSLASVKVFYNDLGFVEDDRVPGYLIVERAERLHLSS